MNYESIILELMSRVQRLESEVESLRDVGDNCKVTTDSVIVESINKVSDTQRTRLYVQGLKDMARAEGKLEIVLRAGDIQKAMGLKNRPVIICNAMRQLMEDGDVILHEPPSGMSTSVLIKYNIKENM